MPSPYTVQQRLALAVVPRLAYMLISLLGITLRYEDVCDTGAVVGYSMPPPAVYAFWHRSLLACAWRFRHLGIAILISQSFDGELIARTIQPLGFLAIRGSSSHGGAGGLRQMERLYRAGHYCAITADGPRGPALRAKPGVTYLARLLDTNVGIFYAAPDRAWQLRSWDRFLIPKPFSRVAIVWTAHVPADETTVQQALDRAVALADPANRPASPPVRAS